MSLAGCQIIPIDLNFHLQKCLETFDKNSADKIQSKNLKEVNPPCLIPIRVKQWIKLWWIKKIESDWLDKYFKPKKLSEVKL